MLPPKQVEIWGQEPRGTNKVMLCRLQLTAVAALPINNVRSSQMSLDPPYWS